jgi:hypothetical protein
MPFALHKLLAPAIRLPIVLVSLLSFAIFNRQSSIVNQKKPSAVLREGLLCYFGSISWSRSSFPFAFNKEENTDNNDSGDEYLRDFFHFLLCHLIKRPSSFLRRARFFIFHPRRQTLLIPHP